MNKINSLRQEKGLKLKELADILEVSEATVSRWENGKSEIRGKNLKKLTDFFEVSISYILGYSDMKNMPDISGKLKSLREDRGLTIKELAKSVRVLESDILLWENGEDIPAINQIKRIADSLDIPAAFLLGYIDNLEDIYGTGKAQVEIAEMEWLSGIIASSPLKTTQEMEKAKKDLEFLTNTKEHWKTALNFTNITNKVEKIDFLSDNTKKLISKFEALDENNQQEIMKYTDYRLKNQIGSPTILKEYTPKNIPQEKQQPKPPTS